MVALANLHDLRATLLANAYPGRVVVVGNGVEELNLAALALQASKSFFQGLGNDAVGINRALHYLSLIGAENTQATQVGGGLTDHHVTRVNHDFGN